MLVSRNALRFVVLTVLVDAIGIGIIIPVMPELIMELGGTDVSGAAVIGGWLFFSFAAVQFVSAPVLGNLGDRFGRRPVLLLSLFAFGVDYLIMGFAPTLAWLFVGRVLAGIPGASYTTAYAYLADLSLPHDRAKAFGMLGAAFGTGFVVGPGIGGLLGALGPRAPFLAAAGLAFANLTFGYFVLKESLPPERRRAFRWRRANPLGALAALGRHRGVLGLAAALFLWGLATQVYPAVWSFFAILRFGWSEALIGASLALAGVTIATSQAVVPRLLIPRIGERRATALALTSGAVGFAGYGFATAGWMMFAWLLTGLLSGLAQPALNAMMSKRIPPDAQGELQGAVASMFGLAAIVGPPFMAMLFGTFTAPGSAVRFPGAPFAAASLLAVVALVVFAFASRFRSGAEARATPPAPAPPT